MAYHRKVRSQHLVSSQVKVAYICFLYVSSYIHIACLVLILSKVIELHQGHWYRLRVAVVEPKATPRILSFNGGDCTIYKVASDGVWHSADFTAYIGSSFELTGASRADFAIRCNQGTADIKWGQKVAATIHANVFGGGMGSTGDDAADLGSAPTRPPSLAGIDTASVPQVNQKAIALNANTIEGVGWPNGLGDIAFDEGEKYPL